MKRSKFTEEQIAFAPRQRETGTRVAEICLKMGTSEQTFYRFGAKRNCFLCLSDGRHGALEGR